MDAHQDMAPLIETTEARGFTQSDDDDDVKGIYVDWLGHPVGDDRVDLGGWKCSACVIGCNALGNLAFLGVIYNLVLYLVQVCGQTNAAAANTVTNITGTALLCSFLGAFLGDTSMGRLWTTMTFQILTLLSYASISVAALIISKGLATATARSILLVSLYLMAITGGPILPNILVLGADQLSLNEEKERYFRLLTILSAIGQLLAVTLVTYIDNGGMWIWGFWFCTASVLGSTTLLAVMVRRFHQYKASGNPFLRVIKVLVAAWRKRLIPLPKDPSVLHECHGNLSAIPGLRKLPHTSSLSFLDKAAVLGVTEINSQSNSWRLCTVTQVEEFKSLLRVIPVGIASTLVNATGTQTSTLFEEQANVMNRQVTTWLVIPPASLNLFCFGSVMLTGIVTSACGARLLGMGLGRQRHGKNATSLQLQGVALVCSIIAMVIAALVESHRLLVAQEGTLLSVLWLVPQTVLAGAGMYFAYAGGYDFFYNEAPDGMRTVSSSILFIFQGAGSYLSSILVTIVTAITTQGGKPGWIARNLNQGHLDYFYWFLASCLAFTLGVYLVYTHLYNYSKGKSQVAPHHCKYEI